jgi:Lipocalin-like domain
MIAYTGCYRLESDQFITTVDVSWNEEWTGTEQARFYTLDGDRLHIMTAWMPNPIHRERIVRGILSWKRAQ